MTSPPYWDLLDYVHQDQLGRESTPENVIDALLVVTREVRRVLRDDGLLWLNLGDSYVQRPGTSLKVKDLAMVPHRVPMSMQSED